MCLTNLQHHVIAIIVLSLNVSFLVSVTDKLNPNLQCNMLNYVQSLISLKKVHLLR